MPAFENLGLAEPSTITAVVATVTIDRGSTTEHQEILVIGDSESSIGLARVLNSTPASTSWGVAVREVAHSTGPFAVSSIAGPVTVRSSAADALVTVYQSTAANLQATVTPASTTWAVQLSNYSTTVNVSSLGGVVTVTGSVDAREVIGSAMTYGQVTLGSTAVQIAAGSTSRKRLFVVQHSTIDVFLGASTVSVVTGVLLAGTKGNQLVFKNDDAVFGISTGGSPVVSFVQETQ